MREWLIKEESFQQKAVGELALVGRDANTLRIEMVRVMRLLASEASTATQKEALGQLITLWRLWKKASYYIKKTHRK